MNRAALVLAVALALGGCAGSAKPRPETAGRMKDAAPERAASQRAAARGLELEREDERWGIEAAREHRRAEDQKKAKRAADAADKRVDVRR